MSDTDKKQDQEKGDEILKRMLKTHPAPKGGKPKSVPSEKPIKDRS